MAGRQSKEDIFVDPKWTESDEDGLSERTENHEHERYRQTSASSVGSRTRPSIASTETRSRRHESSFTSSSSPSGFSRASINRILASNPYGEKLLSWYGKSIDVSLADPKLPSATGPNSDGETDEEENTAVSTHRALTDFAKIARQNRVKEAHRKKRMAKYRQPEEINQRVYQDLKQWHSGSEKSWIERLIWPKTDPSISHADLLALADYYFPPRSQMKVYITDFKESSAESYEVPLCKIMEHMSEKDSSIKVRWLHVPLGYGPLHSTIEDIFLHAGKQGRTFENMGRAGWPFAEIEVLDLQSRVRCQQQRDVFYMLSSQPGLLNDLTHRSWNDFEPSGSQDKESILHDLRWRTTHLGLADDGKTLPDFWTVVGSDISWQLSEGVSMPSYGPLERLEPLQQQINSQALHGDKTYGSTQLVRDVFRCFHREDGFLLTLSAMNGVNYIDRHLRRHLEEPPGAIFENDVASAIAFVRHEFDKNGTSAWHHPTVEWLVVHLLTEIGMTPHCERQGYNAPTLEVAYEKAVERLKSRRHDHFQRRRNNFEPAELIMDHLVCKDELRRIIFIFEKKAKAFNQLLLDAQTFEEEDDLKEDLPANNEALSMKDMAKAALQRTELQAEVFQRLFTDLEMSLQAVYELRSIQQRQLAVIGETQNKTLFVLAIVTIVMLPLQSLTGYWGMNLTGVRDTRWNQTEFWKLCGTAVFVVMGTILTLATLRMLGSVAWRRHREAQARRRIDRKLVLAKEKEKFGGV